MSQAPRTRGSLGARARWMRWLMAGSSPLALACRTPAPAQDSSEPVHAPAQEASSADQAPEKAAPPPPPPALPSDLNFESIVELEVPGDRKVRVLHARAPEERALLYFHGMCSSTTPAEIWAKKAAAYGTLIMLHADVPCGDRPGNKWPKDPALLTARIDRALEAVRTARAGHLDTKQLGLIGYSQGAHRVEVLAGYAPERYPWLILGGPPEAAIPANFSGARAVAVLGGELENTEPMKRGVTLLTHKGIRAKFFLLPSSYHGTYGPKGAEIMSDALAWTFGGAS